MSLVAYCMVRSKILKLEQTTAHMSPFVPQLLHCDGYRRKTDVTASLWRTAGRAAMCDVIELLHTLAPHG
jgi:hypothetical protein